MSAASAWEMAINKRLGKLDMPGNLEYAMKANHFLSLPISIAHVYAVADLPAIHEDPFDRVLVAQTKL